MPVLSRRARLLALATLLALAAGIAAVALLRPGQVVGLDLPDSLPAEPEDAEVLLAVGDIGNCDAGADEAVAALAARLPGAIALLGDIAYPDGSAGDFATCFEPAWGPMRPRLHPAPGNHEYETPEAVGYFEWFGASAGTQGEGWYSFELGDWHVVSLNSNCSAVGGCGAGSPQLAWLEADLAARPSDCLLAFWHHPRYSSGRHGTIHQTDALWAALIQAGMDVALAGHDHSYERLTVDGVREFVVGTGGRSHYPFEREPIPGSEVRHGASYGLLWLALGAREYRWEFLSLGRPTFTDIGSGDCS